MMDVSEMNYRVVLELGGDLPADRLCALLRAVDELGSLNRAAAELKLSYRYAWGLVKAAEERLGAPLLAKRVGGAQGGGATLTDQARDLLRRYTAFQQQVEAGASRSFASDIDETAPVLLAATIGPVETGLVPALEEAFYQATGILVRHIAAGSGQALSLGREGRADLVLAHAPRLEAAFLEGGYGTARFPLMSNDFLLLGPPSDPAGVRTAGSAAEAFRRCAEAGAKFMTRGDQSGTHVRELALWEAAGVAPGAHGWYRVCPRGSMGSLATLRCAAEEQAYVLADRATYLAARGEAGLPLLFAGGVDLRNDFALIPVSPDRHPHVRHEAATRFARWATGPEGQALIQQFGCDRYAEPLFRPVPVPGR